MLGTGIPHVFRILWSVVQRSLELRRTRAKKPWSFSSSHEAANRLLPACLGLVRFLRRVDHPAEMRRDLLFVSDFLRLIEGLRNRAQASHRGGHRPNLLRRRSAVTCAIWEHMFAYGSDGHTLPLAAVCCRTVWKLEVGAVSDPRTSVGKRDAAHVVVAGWVIGRVCRRAPRFEQAGVCVALDCEENATSADVFVALAATVGGPAMTGQLAVGRGALA